MDGRELLGKSGGVQQGRRGEGEKGVTSQGSGVRPRERGIIGDNGDGVDRRG